MYYEVIIPISTKGASSRIQTKWSDSKKWFNSMKLIQLNETGRIRRRWIGMNWMMQVNEIDPIPTTWNRWIQMKWWNLKKWLNSVKWSSWSEIDRIQLNDWIPRNDRIRMKWREWSIQVTNINTTDRYWNDCGWVPYIWD